MAQDSRIDSSVGPLAGRRVLVTGGTGFIGAHVVRRFFALGAEVYATSRARYVGPDPHVRWIACDLADVAAAQSAFAVARPEFVIHLASRVSGGRDVALVQPTLRDNLLSTVNVLVAAQEQAQPRVVLAGSMEEPRVIGDAAVTPSSPYAAAKWAAGAYARMFHALYGLPVVLMRIFMVYGPGQRDRTKLVPYVIRSLLCGDRPQLTSGTRAIDWIYVDDVVDALVTAAVDDRAVGEEFDIGSGETITIRELVERIVSTIGDGCPVPMFGNLADRPLETSTVADVRRAEQILGWSSRTNLDDGLRMTVDWIAAEDGIELRGTSA